MDWQRSSGLESLDPEPLSGREKQSRGHLNKTIETKALNVTNSTSYTLDTWETATLGRYTERRKTATVKVWESLQRLLLLNGCFGFDYQWNCWKSLF